MAYHIELYPSTFRKTICEICGFILFGLFPRTRYFFTRALMRVSLFHIVKTWYQYKFQQPRKYKYFLSVLACVKDEAEYLEEWIEYYLLQGVEHFYIYNNNGTDNSLQVIQKYIDKGLITWIDFPGEKQQRIIYNTAIEHFKNETKWLAVVDLDEFIVFTTPLHTTIADWLKTLKSCSQVLIYWCMYGSSGHQKKTPGLVMERFTQHASKLSKWTKAIVNPRTVAFADVHWNLVFGKTINENNETFWGWKKLKPTASKIRVNHYIVKSFEEYLDKKKRGAANRGMSAYDTSFFYDNDKNDIDESDLMYPYVQKVKKNLKK